MKVLITGLSHKLGGIEKIIFDYISHIDLSGLEIGILCEYETVCFETEFAALGCKIERVCTRKNPFAYYREILKVITEGRYEAVHLNILSCANILPMLAAKRCGTKLIVHSHNSDIPNGCSLTMLLRQLLHKMNRPWVSNASDMRLACSTEAGVFMFGSKQSFVVLNNAIDTKKYAFNAEKRNCARTKFGIDDRTVVFGHTGRFEEQKNQEFAIQVFAEYKKQNRDAKLILVGTGSHEAKCRRLAEKLGISDSVIFYGLADKDEISFLLCAFDIFIFPSRFEGFSLSAVESLCSGLPVIASDAVSKEMDITGTVSWLSLKDDLSVWAKKCEELLQNQPDRKDASKIIEEKGYDIFCTANILKDIYFGKQNKQQEEMCL